MYCFGFYLHLPEIGRTYEDLALCHTERGFKFYMVNRKIVPNDYWYSTSNYYRISHPLICKIDSDNINEIYFIKDFSMGFEPHMKNGWFISNFKFNSPILSYNDKPFIEGYIDGEINQKFARLLIHYVVTMKLIDTLQKEASYISPNSNDQAKDYVISKFKKYINSFDMNRILSSLYVEVNDAYRTKVGGDDKYTIWRTAQLKDENVIIDEYITKIIGLGKECIYEDSGYTSSLKIDALPFIKEHPLGVYSGDALENEKQRIMSLYSREEHMAYLFYQQLSEQQQAANTLFVMRETQKKIVNELKDIFYYDKLLSLDERLFYDFSSKSKDHNDVLIALNKNLNNELAK